MLWGLRRHFRAGRFDVVHGHNLKAAILSAPAARLAGVPAVVATRHSLVAPPYFVRREIQFSLAMRLFDGAVAAVCEATRRNLAAAPLADPRRIVVVYNGAAPAPRDPTAQLPPREGFTFLWVGRLAPPKDPALLLEALALARREADDLFLWVIGDGVLAPGLHRLAGQLQLEPFIRFFGERRDVGNFLSAADAFVLCSRSEGLPVSLLEAMSAGLPAVVSSVGGAAEAVQICDAGIAVQKHDAASFARALLECRRQAASAPVARIQDCYRRRFTLDCMAENYHRLYQTALGLAPPPRPAPPAASATP